MTLANRTPRVMHVVSSLDTGGAEMQLAQLVLARKAAGDVVVSLIPGGAVRARLDEAGVIVCDLGMKRGAPSLKGLLRLITLIRSIKPEIVQSWMYHANLLSGLALRLSGRREETRLIWGIRCSDMDFRQYGRDLHRVVRLCGRFSRAPDVIVANSNTGRAVHEQIGYRPRRFEVIDNGIDTARYRPNEDSRAAVRAELGIERDVPVIASVARVDPMKDHDTLLRALAQVENAHALLVGLGTEKLGVSNGCRALGERSDVPRVLSACDMTVSSSAFGEGFSNAIAEGMAVGLPAVVTDVGDSARIVDNTGLVVPPRDADALAEAICALVTEPQAARNERRRLARKRIEEQFSIARNIQAFHSLYASLN